MTKICHPLENIQGDGTVLHVLADQVADIFARCRVHVFIARALIDISSELIGQLHVRLLLIGIPRAESRTQPPW